MQTRTLTYAIAASLVTAMFAFAPMGQIASASPAGAQDQDSEFQANDTVKCEMDFTLTGWSVFYKSSSGSGTIKCNNGKTMDVVLDVTGGGLTVGHYEINDGHGNFTAVSDISQVLGSYAMATAHAGAVKSSHAAVMTNGTSTLTITGTGNGWDIGVGFASFQIKRASAVDANTSTDM